MISLIDKYAEYMCRKAGSGDGVSRRQLDPDYMSPDVFYAMDEVDGKQILHRFDKSGGAASYTGTFRILYKTEDLGRFCLIMKRVRNFWSVEEHKDSYELEKDMLTVAEYYPGVQSRIYLRGLDEKAMKRVIEEFEQRQRKKLELPAVSIP